MKIAARLWLDAPQTLMSIWKSFASELIKEFSTANGNANIHLQISGSIRK